MLRAGSGVSAGAEMANQMLGVRVRLTYHSWGWGLGVDVGQLMGV